MQLLDKVLLKLGHSLGLPSKYKLLKKIGAGAEGEVWVGLNTEEGNMVACKLVPRGSKEYVLEMAKREFSMLAQLGPSHLNIVRPLEIVLTSKHLVLITEYVPGGTLSRYLCRHPVDEQAARYFFKQVVDAIAFCHARKIVYRDIKPANVLVTGTQPPFLKLCDFGLADSWEGRPGPLFKSLVGTPGYMAPEIMSSFFSTAAELARCSREPSKIPAADPPAAAAAAAATAAAAAGEIQPATSLAFKDAGSTYASVEGGITGNGSCQLAGTSGCGLTRVGSGLKVTASGKLSSAVVAAAKAAVAAMPGSLCSSLGCSMKGDPDAEAQLESVPTYVGTKADVYSLGVLLVVMMLRRMPWNYDVYAERLPALKAMKALYDLQMLHKVTWREGTPSSETFSPSLAALLDGMLDPNPVTRLTLEQVRASDWMREPMPHKLQCAWDVLEEQQQMREDRYQCAVEVTAAAAGTGDGVNFQSGAAVQQQLDEMIEAAKTVGKGYKLISQLPLTNLHLLQQQMLHHQQQLEARDSASEDSCTAAIEDSCTAAIITADAAVESAAEAGAGTGSFKGGVMQTAPSMMAAQA